jgi:hypothetical protein
MNSTFTAQDLHDLFVNGFTPSLTVETCTNQYGASVVFFLNGVEIGETTIEYPVLGTEHTCWHAADGECEYDDDADCPNVGPYISQGLTLKSYAKSHRDFDVSVRQY